MDTEKQDSQHRINRKFTSQEDTTLKKLVHDLGENSWSDISLKMKDRNPRQCHDRWFYYLSPKINNSPWTPEEDERLITLCYQLNGKWVKISKYFKGRTDTQIKNRWNILNRKFRLPGIPKTEESPKVFFQGIFLPKPTETIKQESIINEESMVGDIFQQFLVIFNENENNSLDNTFDFLD